MKKLLLLSLLLAVLVCVPVYAAETDDVCLDVSVSDAGALLELWAQEALDGIDATDTVQMARLSFPYPECINGVWSTDGSSSHLTFAYLPGHKDEAEAELACVQDQSTVRLVEGGPYSIAELLEVQEAVAGYMGSGSCIASCGIAVMNNRVFCDIVSSMDNAGATKDELTALFSDKIRFEEISGFATPAIAEALPAAAEDPVLETTGNAASEASSRALPVISVAVMVVLLATIIFFAIRSNRNN